MERQPGEGLPQDFGEFVELILTSLVTMPVDVLKDLIALLDGVE